jgi:hypothetical protein
LPKSGSLCALVHERGHNLLDRSSKQLFPKLYVVWVNGFLALPPRDAIPSTREGVRIGGQALSDRSVVGETAQLGKAMEIHGGSLIGCAADRDRRPAPHS